MGREEAGFTGLDTEKWEVEARFSRALTCSASSLSEINVAFQLLSYVNKLESNQFKMNKRDDSIIVKKIRMVPTKRLLRLHFTS